MYVPSSFASYVALVHEIYKGCEGMIKVSDSTNSPVRNNVIGQDRPLSAANEKLSFSNV